MDNPFQPPQTEVADIPADTHNNSGGGKSIVLPEGVSGWSWGALFWNWIWAIFNKTWIGLIALVPYLGFIAAFYLGFKGRELAWRNKRWDSLEHFNRVQRAWSRWAVIIMAVGAVGVIAALLIPALSSGGFAVGPKSAA